jgi:hypothetical protein
MSRGINVYEALRESFGTINESKAMEKQAASDKPCIFLSHKSDDKDAVREIGDYIRNQGINIYLDEDDLELQCQRTVKTSQGGSNENQPL